jgi:hypothetical protein
MTDQQDRPGDLTNHGLEAVAVAAVETAQRVRRSDHRHVFAEKLVIQTTKAGRVSERAVDENNGWISHFQSLRSDWVNGSTRTSGDVGIMSTDACCTPFRRRCDPRSCSLPPPGVVSGTRLGFSLLPGITPAVWFPALRFPQTPAGPV